MSQRHPHSPIYAIRAEEYIRGIRDSDIPVIVTYNGNHFESLEPKTEADSLRSIELIKDFSKGDYNLNTTAISRLTNTVKTEKNTKGKIVLRGASKGVTLNAQCKLKFKDIQSLNSNKEIHRGFKCLRCIQNM